MQKKTFKPTGLPGNEFALKHLIYLSRNDYKHLETQQNTRSGSLFVEIKGFVLRAEKLDAISDGEVGLSSFFRESLRVSKLDELVLRPFATRELNPLDRVEVQVEIAYRDEDEVQPDKNGAVTVAEQELVQALRLLTDGRFLNLNEILPLSLMGGGLILKASVKAVESLKDGNEGLTFGVLEKESEVSVSVVSA